MDVRDIVGTALSEHQLSGESETEVPALPDADALAQTIESRLENEDNIPDYSHSCEPLSIVRFRCMLQDTGYPMEVYLPGHAAEAGPASPWGNLRERWVGWGVELPGATSWTRTRSADQLSESISALHLNGSASTLPSVLRTKYPLPDQQSDYLGALIKVYDDVSFKPASTHTFVGILSAAALPTPLSTSDTDEATMVPCIHVLKGPLPVDSPIPPSDPEAARSGLVRILASCFNPPDTLAAEYLLLALISSPSVRPAGLPPLGTLSLNLIRASSNSVATVLRSLVPLLVEVSLTLPLLHSARFNPSSSDSASLDSGLLQVAEQTVMLIDESGMGDGGKLEEKAVKNLQALTETIVEQKVRYEYAYMDGLKMDTVLRPIVVSEGKSLIPVDVHLPVEGSPSGTSLEGGEDLALARAYLLAYGSMEHARKLKIPDSTAAKIQDDFVAHRQNAASSSHEDQDAEAVLKRRMKIARLYAISYPDATLTEDRWRRVVALDEGAARRLDGRIARSDVVANGH